MIFPSHKPKSKKKVETETVVQFFAEGVPKLSSDTFVKNVKLPKTLPKSNKKSCDIIQVSYELKVEAEVLGFHLDIDFKYPITLGSIPFVEVNPELASAGSKFPIASAPTDDRKYFSRVLCLSTILSILQSRHRHLTKPCHF